MQNWNLEQRSLNEVYDLASGAGISLSKLNLNFLFLNIFLGKSPWLPSDFQKGLCQSFKHDVSTLDTF